MRAGQLLDARQRLRLDRGRISRSPPPGSPGCPSPPAAAGAAPGAVRGPRRKAFTSSVVMRPFSPVPFSFVRSTSSSRARRRTDGARMDSGEIGRRRRGCAGAAWLGGARCRRCRGCGRRLPAARWPKAAGVDRRIARRRLRASQPQDRRAFAHPVADLDQDLLDRAGLGGRHVHGRLVGFERDERVVDASLCRPA